MLQPLLVLGLLTSIGPAFAGAGNGTGERDDGGWLDLDREITALSAQLGGESSGPSIGGYFVATAAFSGPPPLVVALRFVHSAPHDLGVDSQYDHVQGKEQDGGSN